MAVCCWLIGSDEEAIGLMERYERLIENNAFCPEEVPIYLLKSILIKSVFISFGLHHLRL